MWVNKWVFYILIVSNLFGAFLAVSSTRNCVIDCKSDDNTHFICIDRSR